MIRSSQENVRFARRARHRLGLTLIESLVLVTIISIVAVGAGIGLQSTARNPGTVDTMLAIDRAVADAMERKVVDAHANFASAAGYTDTVTINSTSYTRTVTVTALTAPDGSGACTDYIQITAQIGNQSATTYVTNP